MELSWDDFIKRGEALYGKNRKDWKFVCPACKRVQSANTIVEQMETQKKPSQRHGFLRQGESMRPEAECYSHTCNWVAYGLFNSGILIIIEPSMPHNADSKLNCMYVFPLADDKEMLKEVYPVD